MKIFLILILLLNSENLFSNNFNWPKWHWNNFKLNDYLEVTNQNPTQLEIESYLNTCIQDISEENCNDANVMLILLSKLNSSFTITAANNLLIIISDKQNIEFYYLRLYALRALARVGEIDKLISFIGESTPKLEDIFILAQINDYRWIDLFKGYLNGNNADYYCSAMNYIKPFIETSYVNNSEFVNLLITNTLDSNIRISTCSVSALLKNSFVLAVKPQILSKIDLLLVSGDLERIKLAKKLAAKWPIDSENMNTFLMLLNFAVVTKNNDIKYYSNSMLYEQNQISKLFPRFNPQDAFPNDTVLSIGSNSMSDYFVYEVFNIQWQEYVNQLSFFGLKELLKNLLENKKTTNLSEKLQFLSINSLITNNTYLSVELAKLIVNVNLILPNSLLSKVYSNSSSLQKLALIGRFPEHFSSKPVIRVNTNDPWIKLAEVTNLLTICNIEVPPIGNELSDPTKLTKYLEDAETLMKDCSRVNP